MSTEGHQIRVGGLDVDVVRKPIKNLHLGVYPPNGRVRVAAPVGVSDEAVRLTSSTEGAVIPRLYGRMRLGGNIIWATDFREETRTTSQGGGKGGGGPKVTTTEYLYFASFAVALCEGPITGIGRVWADGKALDMTGVTWRWYPGDEVQTPDPFISAKMGAASNPAYRGTAYVVLEELDLTPFGNRLPQISFEVFRPLADPDTAEGLVRAVTMIPASGEFAYATVPVKKSSGSGSATVAENLNAIPETPDIVVALDRLQSMAPAVESVSLVVAWFGDDLRAGSCKVRPGVEVAAKATTPSAWVVNGVSRASAVLVSRDAEDRPVYGGTPADFAVVQAIQEITARGLRVTFYPFVLLDVPPGNTLPNPYSNNAATAGQPTFPWRGRITCSPAAGYVGSVDKTGTAAAQVAALFGTATPGSFSVVGEAVSWTGPVGEWSLRRMILHYAHLCAAAGGVDAFLIGSELPGLTTIRSGAATYPVVTALKALAADVRAILGAGPKIGYAGDWSEYFGHHPADGSGDVFFHLDPLWSDANIDFIGIDNYMPLSDWRDGFDHADAALAPAIYDRAYLQFNIAGGEGFDWFYASPSDRAAQIRTAITDGAAAKPWVFRIKDLRAWWQNPHFNRPGGIESGIPTAWVPQSKPLWFTELGCPAIDRGTNQPNVFFDPKSSESFTPYFSRGWRDDAIQRAYLEATYLFWGSAANNPTSVIYGDRMVHVPECAAWTWDARPYPFFPELTTVWTDGPNWRLGHWLAVHPSGFYAWLREPFCQRALEDQRQTVLLKQAWDDSGEVYGYRKLHDDLCDLGEDISPNRTWRLARLAGIRAQIGYKKKSGSYGGSPAVVADNTLNREFDVDAPDQFWVTDLTYIRTHEGFLYLAVVIDLFSRRVVGWSMQGRTYTDLPLQALLMAVWRRKPKTKVQVHSDQGSQFTSYEWQEFLEQHNLTQSMSRRGNCWDNAVAESFFNLLKRERIRRRKYKTREEARQDVFDYIEFFYNPQRKHVRNGMLSPIAFEQQQKLKLQGV